jgi:hypothetical protein
MLIQEQEQTQLQLFEASLPAKPYCSDDLEFGLLIRQAKQAIQKKHIQHNKPTSVHWLAFDCDYAGAIEEAKSNLLPAPNIAVLNRQNGHSHLLYGLEVPVHRTAFARAKPLQFLAKVEFALREGLRADNGYAGLVVKNPLHSHWLTYELNPRSYDLPELADWLTLPTKLPTKAEQVGLGRNCTLFERLRRWAYGEVLGYRLTATYEAFKDGVLVQAMALNTFPSPLPQSEIRSTALSVAKWTWNKYTGRVSDEEFSAIQASRGRLGGKAGGRGRTTLDQEKRLTALSMASQGDTQRAIADHLGVSQGTVSKWLKK